MRGWISVLGDASMLCWALVLFSVKALGYLFAFNLVLLVYPCLTSPGKRLGREESIFPGC